MTTASTRLDQLAAMPTRQLRAEWRRAFGAEPLHDLTRDLLLRALAYRAQERATGGLSQAARRALRNLIGQMASEGAPGTAAPVRALQAGTRLVREWGGEVHSVLVLENGVEYRDRRYRSLTELACLISGAHWSGPRFFGLVRSRKPNPQIAPGRIQGGAEEGRGDGQA